MERAQDAGVHAWLVPAGRCAPRQALVAAAAELLDTDPAGVEVLTEPGGRPAVRAAAGAVWVSLSHGPGTLAVAASLAGPVGIDVEGEAAGPEVVELAGRWFSAAEADWLRDRPATGRTRDFLLLWTAKEALGKASGAGLRGAGLRRRVPLPPVVDGGFHPVAGGRWLAHPEPRAGLVLAVASGVPVPGLTVHDRSPHDRSPHDRSPNDRIPHDRDSRTDHVAAARSTARSRLNLPVVVRGN